MTRETIEWLNTNTLIGFTERRGTAWHYRSSSAQSRSNHYPGAIPASDVSDRLFGWQGITRRVAVELPATDLGDWTHQDENGNPLRWVVLDDKRAVDRSDRETGEIFGVVGGDYTIHQYREWLLESVETLLHGGLQISSAGLLRKGAIAWVEVSVPENASTAEGVEYRPNLLATTSMDGSCATTYKRTVTDVVCDNTRAVALREKSATLKVRHSKNSELLLTSARDALQIVEKASADFAQQVAELCRIRVHDRAWEAVLTRLVPIDRERDVKHLVEQKEKKRAALDSLYRNDPRCDPWQGTAHGVIQAVNTWEHHARLPQKRALRKPSLVSAWRAERNMQRTVDGRFEELDRGTFRLLKEVLATTN